MSIPIRFLRRLVVVAALLCTTTLMAESSRSGPIANRADIEWLDRITYGVDSAALERLHTIGRKRFLDEQLAARDDRLPPTVAARIDALDVSHLQLDAALTQLREQRVATRAMEDGAAKQDARKAMRQRGNELATQAAQIQLLRAVHSPAQLQEQMTWFWLNHFSVFQAKADVNWLVGDYATNAIRPHALGRFRDLVMATLTHPAMLQYLDNAQNAAGHINENYARELMELHTLGVGGGYTQKDVQELARLLTGVGLSRDTDRNAGFAFIPARHDHGDKLLLGQTIHGGGIEEVGQAIDILVRQPACAKFVSREIAQYFVADAPPAALVERMSKTFQRSDGNIPAVLRTMFDSKEFIASLGNRYKDPYRFVVSSLRLSYDGTAMTNPGVAVDWLRALGEPLYGRITPDGYPLESSAWTSSGQLSKRFEIATTIASGRAGDIPQFAAMGAAFDSASPALADRVIAPLLPADARTTLTAARSPRERSALLLSSPAFNRF
jgi:uncharacterized protein (DUF1800 family)